MLKKLILLFLLIIELYAYRIDSVIMHQRERNRRTYQERQARVRALVVQNMQRSSYDLLVLQGEELELYRRVYRMCSRFHGDLSHYRLRNAGRMLTDDATTAFEILGHSFFNLLNPREHFNLNDFRNRGFQVALDECFDIDNDHQRELREEFIGMYRRAHNIASLGSYAIAARLFVGQNQLINGLARRANVTVPSVPGASIQFPGYQMLLRGFQGLESVESIAIVSMAGIMGAELTMSDFIDQNQTIEMISQVPLVNSLLPGFFERRMERIQETDFRQTIEGYAEAQDRGDSERARELVSDNYQQNLVDLQLQDFLNDPDTLDLIEMIEQIQYEIQFLEEESEYHTLYHYYLVAAELELECHTLNYEVGNLESVLGNYNIQELEAMRVNEISHQLRQMAYENSDRYNELLDLRNQCYRELDLRKID